MRCRTQQRNPLPRWVGTTAFHFCFPPVRPFHCQRILVSEDASKRTLEFCRYARRLRQRNRHSPKLRIGIFRPAKAASRWGSTQEQQDFLAPVTKCAEQRFCEPDQARRPAKHSTNCTRRGGHRDSPPRCTEKRKA